MRRMATSKPHAECGSGLVLALVRRLVFDRLDAEITGTLDGENLSGRWIQPGTDLALTLSRFERPLPSAEDVELLAGSWAGTVRLGQAEMEFAFAFGQDDLGELVATVENRTYGGSWEMGTVRLQGSELHLYSNTGFEVGASVVGDTITGELRVPGMSTSLLLAREEAPKEGD